MSDEFGRIQTYAQVLKEMNTGDMAQWISNYVNEVSGVKISYETIRERLESPTELAEDIKSINKMDEESYRYLYGECDDWVKDNFKNGLEIVAIMEKNNHEEGIVHCYLRNPVTENCYDVRGEFRNDDEILRYTGFEYNSIDTEEFIFHDINNFQYFLNWVEFEQVRYLFEKIRFY